MPVFMYWLAAVAGLVAITRVLPIKALHPMFLQHPQVQTMVFWVVVAVALLLLGVIMASNQPRAPGRQY